MKQEVKKNWHRVTEIRNCAAFCAKGFVLLSFLMAGPLLGAAVGQPTYVGVIVVTEYDGKPAVLLTKYKNLNDLGIEFKRYEQDSKKKHHQFASNALKSLLKNSALTIDDTTYVIEWPGTSAYNYQFIVPAEYVGTSILLKKANNLRVERFVWIVRRGNDFYDINGTGPLQVYDELKKFLNEKWSELTTKAKASKKAIY